MTFSSFTPLKLLCKDFPHELFALLHTHLLCTSSSLYTCSFWCQEFLFIIYTWTAFFRHWNISLMFLLQISYLAAISVHPMFTVLFYVLPNVYYGFFINSLLSFLVLWHPVCHCLSRFYKILFVDLWSNGMNK